MSKQVESGKRFEWRAKFLVEGAFPSNLPRTITEECILEKLEKEEDIQDKAILAVRVCRSLIPSKEELEEVKKFAYEKAQRTASLYSLFLGHLRILKLVSVLQLTPFEKKKHYLTAAEARFRVAISENEWIEGVKSLEGVATARAEEYVSLALSHYTLAFLTEPKSRFLNLMICMEALYNRDPQELRYRMSHRVANLLGRTEETRRRIFNDFSSLYSKRNDLAHGLKSVDISNDDNQLLTHYTKYSLIAFLKLGRKKKIILDAIDEAVYDTKVRENIQHDVEIVIQAFEKGFWRSKG